MGTDDQRHLAETEVTTGVEQEIMAEMAVAVTAAPPAVEAMVAVMAAPPAVEEMVAVMVASPGPRLVTLNSLIV